MDRRRCVGGEERGEIGGDGVGRGRRCKEGVERCWNRHSRDDEKCCSE